MFYGKSQIITTGTRKGGRPHATLYLGKEYNLYDIRRNKQIAINFSKQALMLEAGTYKLFLIAPKSLQEVIDDE